ncbi:MAG: 1-deoxy-D-xylulose-5-phosphate synthase [Prolixibacteraceae bacterium]|jgi:1-deoxy-D-xylulose-5-phosphate synthase|nr:1-deoxy-D-xylulose-5-phosphate synthase [Prolixibacteraceae bacterium]
MTGNPFYLLYEINAPSDLRKLPKEKLEKVCEQLRCFLIDTLSETPGHFGASLGVVELTVALHYVFNTPVDKLVWDVGHQAYGHKILTGRRDQFSTLRQYKGLSGFPTPKESEYDVFGVGHSSTSISAALGMAMANQLNNDPSNVVAVIGDGALSGGMAFEALNNASEKNPNLLIILNDNNMSIDPNVGGLNNYLIKISASETYNRLRNKVWDFLGLFKWFGRKTRRLVSKVGDSTKSFIFKDSNLFEALNIRYFGPVDGHDVEQLVKLLEQLKKIQGPKILHIITKKGKGFHPAETNQTLFHAPGKFDKTTGKQVVSTNGDEPPLYQKVFGETLLELARANDKIVGITPAMLSGSSMSIMNKEMPHRVFDVGISEQHAVTFAAGLAQSGMIPFCNIYSSFSQRAYDQIIHDVALQGLNVVLCLDRGGLVGADGATHHGAYDLAFLNCIPNITIASPMNEQEFRNLLYTAQQNPLGPFVIRYPRGRGTVKDWRTTMERMESATGRTICEGSDVAVLSIGHVGNFVQQAIQISGKAGQVAHYDMRFLKPLDLSLLFDVFSKFKKIITVEDGTTTGGLGTSVLDFLNRNNYSAKVVVMGIPDYFVEHGKPEELYHECGYDAEGIAGAINKLMSETSK